MGRSLFRLQNALGKDSFFVNVSSDEGFRLVGNLDVRVKFYYRVVLIIVASRGSQNEK